VTDSGPTDDDSQRAAQLARIVELRRQHFSWWDIAADTGLSMSDAHALHADELRRRPVRSIDEHRAEALELSDTVTRELLKIAEDDKVAPRTRLDAWLEIRGWSEHRTRVLGSDAPTRQVIVSVDKVDEETARLEAELGAAEGEGDG
jgi:hypothetical protein